MNGMEKIVMMRMAENFQNNLPDVLYLSHYELAEKYGSSPTEWKKFLKIREVDRFIEIEIANLAEVAARSALQKLQSGKYSSADIQAARQLIEKSKLLTQKTDQPTMVVLTRVPPKRVSENA